MPTVTDITMGNMAGKAQNGAAMPLMKLDGETVYEQKTSAGAADDSAIVCPGNPNGGYDGVVGIAPQDGNVRVASPGPADSNSPLVRQGQYREFAIKPGDPVSIIDP